MAKALPTLSLTLAWLLAGEAAGAEVGTGAATELPALEYHSIFSRYHGYREGKVTSWPAANAGIGNPSGHHSAPAGEDPENAADPPPDTPAPMRRHHGHQQEKPAAPHHGEHQP